MSLKEIKDQFVPYEQALKLKEIGFDEKCLTKWGCTSLRLYDNYKSCTNKDDIVLSGDFVSAPLWQQAFDWFREKYSMPNWVYESTGGWWYRIVKGDYWIEDRIKFNTFEEARDALLNKLIEIVKI